MKYFKLALLFFFLLSCNEDDIRSLPILPTLYEQVQIRKDNQDLLEKLELTEDKNLEGMVLKHQYQLQVYFNGKQIKDYPSDLYVKKEDTTFYYLEFFTDLELEYDWEDTGFTQNYTEYKLKCPRLFGDEQFHVIRIDFTFENRQVHRTKITLDGREGKIEKQDNCSSLSTIYLL